MELILTLALLSAAPRIVPLHGRDVMVAVAHMLLSRIWRNT